MAIEVKKGAIDKVEFRILVRNLSVTTHDEYFDAVCELVERVRMYESMMETADILADSQTMADIAESQAEWDAGWPPQDS